MSRDDANGDGEEVAPDELYRRIERGEDVTIIDVRGPNEYADWHIDGETVESVNVPGTAFEGGLDGDLVADLPSGGPLVIVCAKGISSATIANLLQANGVDAKNLADGMEGWAEVYVPVEIERYTGSGTLYQYQRPSSGCLGYLLVDGDEAAVFDPLRAFTDRYRRDARNHGADLVYAFDTHIHADHFSGVRSLASSGVVGVLPDSAVERGVSYADEIETAPDGSVFSVGDATVEAIHTPGHTSGMTSYLVDGSVLLTGDGLFTESVARPDLEEGADGAEDAARLLYRSLHDRILPLDDDVVVAGGHFSDSATPVDDGTYTATIGELRGSMTILSADEDDFVERILADMPPRPSNYRSIIGANLGQERVTDARAFQLELGPNNCATSTDALTSNQ